MNLYEFQICALVSRQAFVFIKKKKTRIIQLCLSRKTQCRRLAVDIHDHLTAVIILKSFPHKNSVIAEFYVISSVETIFLASVGVLDKMLKHILS